MIIKGGVFMFPNLLAEQKRKGLSNYEMGEMISASRQTYERKKRLGTFSIKETKILCNFFDCSYEYLFATEEELKKSS